MVPKIPQNHPQQKERAYEQNLNSGNHQRITRKIRKISRENIKKFSINRGRYPKIGQNDLQ